MSDGSLEAILALIAGAWAALVVSAVLWAC